PSAARGRRDRQGFPLRREGAYGLLVVEARGHAVAALDIELGEVDMDVDLAEEGVLPAVGQRALEQDVDAVLAGIGPEIQGHFAGVVRPGRLLLVLEDKELPTGVQEAGLLVEGHRQGDGMDRELLALGAYRAQAPGTVRPGCWGVCTPLHGLQEGG